MIPTSDVTLTPHEQSRWYLTKLVAALIREGIPASSVLADVRDGIRFARRAPVVPAGDATARTDRAAAIIEFRPRRHSEQEGER